MIPMFSLSLYVGRSTEYVCDLLPFITALRASSPRYL